MHKIIDIEERIPKLKKRREKRKNSRFIVVLVILSIALLVLLYFQLPISHLKSIKVTGQVIENKEYYIKHSGASIGESFLSIDTEKIEQKLKKLDTVKKVQVEKKGLNQLVVQITENKKVALLKTDDRYNYVLENGKTVRSRNQLVNFERPILLNMPDEAYRKKLLKQLNQLKPDLLLMISQIEASPSKSNKNLVNIFMNDGFEVKADLKDLASKLQYYPSIVSQLENNKKGVINLEIGGYYNSFQLEYK
ncbi:MAG: FtsQ-type POTRA domain-containing protein [Kurthia sp.]|nr:FtsQ-type POTRA domain-containing protein [Candidatus Kurthia equi]